MTPPIVVRNESGVEVGTTFPKRAKQLVSKNKAKWLDKSRNEIILFSTTSKEENAMESYRTEIPRSDLTDNRQIPQPEEAETIPFEDKELLYLAKRRLSEKRNLIGQILDFCLIGFTMLALVGLYSADERIAVFFSFCLFWGIRLAIRIIKFVKPAFKDGVVNYFHEKRERQIESEYYRLKKMGTGYVYREMNK